MEASASIFGNLETKKIDAIFPKLQKAAQIKSSDLINLLGGMYRTEEGKAHFFKSTRKVEKELFEDPIVNNKEYCTLLGQPEFFKCARELMFGEGRQQIVTAQTLSGCGALSLGVHILKQLNVKKVWISVPSWFGHSSISKFQGLSVDYYPFYSDFKFQYDQMLDCFKSLESGSVIILQAGQHNPTGFNFSNDQWKEMGQVFKERKLFPLIDFAYQGFGTGDVDEDAWGVRYLYDLGIELIVCQSFSKNFSYYNERVGAIHVVIKSEKVRSQVLAQIEIYIRVVMGHPPMHGSRVVTRILSDPLLKQEWKEELKAIVMNITERRHKLREALEALEVPGDWSCITTQRGMFALLPITPQQVEKLEEKKVFMLSSGRIAIGNLPLSKIPSLAERIASVLKSP